MNDNPYLTPNTDLDNLSVISEEASIRTSYLSHEASVKSIGSLFFLAGILVALSIVPTITLGPADLFTQAIFITILLLAFFQIWVALGLRKLKRRSRIPAIILSAIGLLGFPIGTLISAYFLYLLCGKKGKMVFSQEYAQIIEKTPQIRYKTPIYVWILLLLFIAFFSFSIFWAWA